MNKIARFIDHPFIVISTFNEAVLVYRMSLCFIESIDDVTMLSELQLKLEYSEHVMKHLGVLPPAQLFNSFEDEDLCKDLMQRLLKESFKNKDTDTVEFIKRIVDKKLVVFDFCFKVSLVKFQH